jgi:non-ribosomal peptide synthetase component F
LRVAAAGITAWLYEPPAADSASDAAHLAATIPIGNGIYNSRLYVLDADFKPVPIGIPGELWISGVQVTAGYLNRPDLNETTFVPNPFCEGPGTYTNRMYKCGDLVRWLPGKHACLEFLGRVDHQVKLRGFRIELQVCRPSQP